MTDLTIEPTDHCRHRTPTYDIEDDLHDSAEDYCVHCECCCTCLGCEYGPQDGMLMFPNGNPEIEAMAREESKDV